MGWFRRRVTKPLDQLIEFDAFLAWTGFSLASGAAVGGALVVFASAAA